MADQPTLSFDGFRKAALAEGYDQILERSWDPGTVLDEHAHPFDVSAIVTEGEMWLSCQGETRHLRPGDRFELERDVPHAERYGPQGATYWVARRHPR
jgi:AraC-like protein